MKTLCFYLSLIQTSMKASMSKRGAFFFEAGLTIANNLIFFVLWWIFFRQFNDVGGWNFKDMTALMAIGLGGYGMMLVGFGGAKYLSTMIINGDLDPFMIQPKNLLLHVLGSHSRMTGWGNMATAAILIVFGNLTTWPTFPLILMSIVSSCMIYTAVAIIVHSMPFWLGSVENVSKRYCDALYLFSLYPSNIYKGWLQVVMFTVIPAGIIGYVPIELIRHFSWIQLFILLCSSIVFFLLAFGVFYKGLKRYESGNTFGSRIN